MSFIEYATLPPKPIDLNSRNAIKPSRFADEAEQRRVSIMPVNCHRTFISSSYSSDTQVSPLLGGVRLMDMPKIRCPKTGRALTNRYMESATFRSSAVFFSRTYCPHCHAMHEWFAKDAWVWESESSECEAACERQVA